MWSVVTFSPLPPVTVGLTLSCFFLFVLCNFTGIFSRSLDPGLEEAIASLIWATPRLQADIQEFKPITDEFTYKYGKEFAQACLSNQMSNVSEKVMHKLSVQAPPKSLVERYMVEIAKSYNIPFEPDASIMAQDEIMMAENLLIDFDADKKGKPANNGGGPSGGMGVLQPGPALVGFFYEC